MNHILNYCLGKYPNSGCFEFYLTSVLSEICNAPQLPGIYLFISYKDGKPNLAYIGKGGTLMQNGSFKGQLLCGRIRNRQCDLPRGVFLREQMILEGLEMIKIFWFVTFENDLADLPAYVEGLLLQMYYFRHGCLPKWNKAY